MPTDQTPPVSPRKLLYGGISVVVLVVVVAAGSSRAALAMTPTARGDRMLGSTTCGASVAACTSRAHRDVRSALAGARGLFACADHARVVAAVPVLNADIGAAGRAGHRWPKSAADLDQQLLQARADLTNLTGGRQASGRDAGPAQDAAGLNSWSQQEIDERSADLASKEAQVNSMQANVARLVALASYKNVTAPLAGRRRHRAQHRRRRADQRWNRLRCCDVRGVRRQETASLCQRAAKLSARHPDGVCGHRHRAGICRPDVPRDHRGVVAIGRYCVRLDAHAACDRQSQGRTASRRVRQRQAGAVQQRPAVEHSGQRVDFQQQRAPGRDRQPRRQVLFKTVTIARDLGREIEIATGLSADDRIIVTPLDGIADGDAVRIAGGGKDGTPRTSSNSNTKTE